MLAAVALLTACNPPAQPDPSNIPKSGNAEPAASGAIAPGTYSNAPTEGDGEGWRITLANGEASKTAAVTYCAPECGDPVSVPVRIGMGGVMAEYPAVDGRPIALAIRPHGDGIEVAADWGEGLESDKLVRENDVSD
jgi:hypothetical protein